VGSQCHGRRLCHSLTLFNITSLRLPFPRSSATTFQLRTATTVLLVPRSVSAEHVCNEPARKLTRLKATKSVNRYMNVLFESLRHIPLLHKPRAAGCSLCCASRVLHSARDTCLHAVPRASMLAPCSHFVQVRFGDMCPKQCHRATKRSSCF
jgi:hypothetical protein